jgi:hypothetical protein
LPDAAVDDRSDFLTRADRIEDELDDRRPARRSHDDARA